MYLFFLVGYGYVACGDEQGRLWMYHITKTMMENFKSGKIISATEVSKPFLSEQYHNLLGHAL